MLKLVSDLGLEASPFGEYTAENEPSIEDYFVKPPYYNSVEEKALNTGTHILFGARGSGKSATRIALYQHICLLIEEKKEVPLPIVLDEYTRILAGGLSSVSIRSYIDEIGFLVIEALLLWLSNMTDSERRLYTETLLDDEEDLLFELCRDYYLSKPDVARQVSATQAMRVIGKAWRGQTKLWIHKKQSAIFKLIGDIAAGFVKAKSGAEISADSVSDVISGSDGDASLYAQNMLTKIAEIVRIFGFSGITIFVDKVDETDVTSSSAEKSARLLFPLLANTKILEMDGVGWVFFLWVQVREYYNKEDLHVRLDKIRNSEISWEPTWLVRMINQRVLHFSKKELSDIKPFCSTEVDPEEFITDAIELAMKSPRELIRILDTILMANDESRSSGSTHTRLISSDINAGMDKYCKDSVLHIYDRKLILRIVKLRKNLFINKDVQNILRVGASAARSHIQRWQAKGIVSLVGERPASGEQGGKQAHEYKIVDMRIVRIISHNVRLDAQGSQGLFEHADSTAKSLLLNDNSVGEESKSVNTVCNSNHMENVLMDTSDEPETDDARGDIVYRGIVKACSICDHDPDLDGEWHQCCSEPGCSVSASTFDEIEEYFGFRKVGDRHCPQARCRKHR